MELLYVRMELEVFQQAGCEVAAPHARQDAARAAHAKESANAVPTRRDIADCAIRTGVGKVKRPMACQRSLLNVSPTTVVENNRGRVRRLDVPSELDDELAEVRRGL